MTKPTMPETLIDTSAWIDFLRKSDGKVGDKVAELIRSDNAYIAGPIQTELLQGVRGKKEISQLTTLLTIIPCTPVEPDDWCTTGNTLRALREQGLTIPLTDVLIATIAKRNNMYVLTLDKHFFDLPVKLVALK